MIRNGPLIKILKSLKKAENGPFGKNLFPITDGSLAGGTCKWGGGVSGELATMVDMFTAGREAIYKHVEFFQANWTFIHVWSINPPRT